MKKLENLAKILFLFFAVVSLGLVTVSCSDDDENCDSQSFFECYFCTGPVIEQNTHIDSCILIIYENHYWIKQSDDIIHYVCNIKTIQTLLNDMDMSLEYIINNKMQLDLIVDIKENEAPQADHGPSYDDVIVKNIKIHE